MSRCLTSIAFVCVALLFSGCAEESLDVPIDVPDDLSSATRSENTETSDLSPIGVHDWIGRPMPGIDSEVAEPEQPSSANSIWNALLEGTAQAIDADGPQP